MIERNPEMTGDLVLLDGGIVVGARPSSVARSPVAPKRSGRTSRALPGRRSRPAQNATPTARAVGLPSASEAVDRELLLTLLSRCLSLPAAAKATEILLARYGCYAEAICAPAADLAAIPVLGARGASLLRCVHAGAVRLATTPLCTAPVIGSWSALRTYLNTAMARERNEVFRVLFLGAKNHLIGDEAMASGGPAAVQVSVRDIAQRALQLGATAIILLHNHPSGDPTPSELDLASTLAIRNVLQPLGICLHDHVIVGKGRFYSVDQGCFVPA